MAQVDPQCYTDIIRFSPDAVERSDRWAKTFCDDLIQIKITAADCIQAAYQQGARIVLPDTTEHRLARLEKDCWKLTMRMISS